MAQLNIADPIANLSHGFSLSLPNNFSITNIERVKYNETNPQKIPNINTIGNL
jgi:hypothetical protein